MDANQNNKKISNIEPRVLKTEKRAGQIIIVAGVIAMIYAFICASNLEISDTSQKLIVNGLWMLLIGVLLLLHKRKAAQMIIGLVAFIGIFGSISAFVKQDDILNAIYMIMATLSMVFAFSLLEGNTIPKKGWFLSGLFRLIAAIVTFITDVMLIVAYGSDSVGALFYVIMIFSIVYDLVISMALFVLGGKNKPIVVSNSQIVMGEPSSDIPFNNVEEKLIAVPLNVAESENSVSVHNKNVQEEIVESSDKDKEEQIETVNLFNDTPDSII